MIFATVGTNEARFDRLLVALGALRLDEPLVVQCGHSSVRPANANCVEFLDFEEMAAHVRAARAVVTHAGVGSVLLCLAEGVRPIVVPRRRSHGEAVDDHQLEFGRHLDASGLVTLVEDPERLQGALARTRSLESPPEGGHRLALELRDFLADRVRAAAAL